MIKNDDVNVLKFKVNFKVRKQFLQNFVFSDFEQKKNQLNNYLVRKKIFFVVVVVTII